MEKRTTIFRQLIFNIVLPAILALLLLGVLNYQNTKAILINSSENESLIITDEIRHIHEMQDMALDILEVQLDNKMREYSDRLIKDYFKNTNQIEQIDLNTVRLELGMIPESEDIYIINRQGIIVNTTFENDRNLNLFNFGTEHKELIENVFESENYLSERFAIEDKTRRIKKFTYQPTLDGKYIVELGIYSTQADTLIQTVKDRLNNISNKKGSIESVELFIGSDNPFSLNRNAKLEPDHLAIYKSVLETKNKIILHEKKAKKRLQYEYIYMVRKNTDLYKESVIRIVSDKGPEINSLRLELLKFFVIFGATILIVIIMLYRKTRVITDPIKLLVEKVNRISNGHLDERAEIIGNNEIASLSEQFNDMISQLESYYYELEEKVKERTAEIQSQKEEIEAQRDSIQEQRNILSDINKSLQKAYLEIEEQKKHIEDSIHYAKRIQNAILPPDEFVKKHLRDSFILYRPKDIVSGDFYWMSHKDNKTYIAAVDCTGHGVPGAFMSIVGNNQLNYTVNVLGVRTTDEILNSLNEGVTRALRQTRASSSVKDGMDMALLCIDDNMKNACFSGAYNPLYLVRDGELIQIKPDKFPVGGFLDEKLKVFTRTDLELQKGDVLYIFSDGYQDQFGGPKERKFMIKKFRELLLNIHTESMPEQKEILNQVIDDWRGEVDQIDDILVIGVRI
ncbi:MAG: SpoIIE family protein phosphatase [Bacteroidales bacterium]|nr:SpoIIE family protein phosphatase [Bacteroidales bacterium]MCF8390232.1 SpoIIE family protein phosphatase [Bacteroidales bacterium]